MTDHARIGEAIEELLTERNAIVRMAKTADGWFANVLNQDTEGEG